MRVIANLLKEAFSRGKAIDFPLRQVIREFRIGCGQRADFTRMFLRTGASRIC